MKKELHSRKDALIALIEENFKAVEAYVDTKVKESDTMFAERKVKMNKQLQDDIQEQKHENKAVLKSLGQHTVTEAVKLQMGGQVIETKKSILRKITGSQLAFMFSGKFELEKNMNGTISLDEDPAVFKHVLAYLESDRTVLPMAENTDEKVVR